MLFKAGLILIAMAYSLATSSSQPIILQSQLANTLHQTTISAIHRKPGGSLWIGSQHGLFRFDGTQLTSYGSNKISPYWIPSTDIRRLGSTHSGTLLVATHGGGLLTWNPNLGKFDSITQFGHIEAPNLTNLHVSSSGNIWLSTTNQVFSYDLDLGNAYEISKVILNLTGKPEDFLEDRFGNLIIGGSRGLFSINIENGKSSKLALKSELLPKAFGITALRRVGKSDILIGTNTGHVIAIDGKSKYVKAVTLINTQSPSYISDILEQNGNYFIGTDHGLYMTDDQFMHSVPLSDRGSGLSNNSIYRLFADQDFIWVGTWGGLDLLTMSPFDLFNSTNSGISNDVLGFRGGPQGLTWIATYEGLFVLDQKKESHYRFEHLYISTKLRDQRITAIAVREDMLWLGYYRGGVQVIDIDDGTSYSPDLPELNELAVTEILEDPNSSSMWVATLNNGLFRITPNNTVSYYQTNLLPEQSITLLFTSKTTDLLAVSDKKIYRYDRTSDDFSILRLNYGPIKDPIVYSIKQSKSGNIWIGTQDYGLFLWTPEKQLGKDYNLERINTDGKLGPSTIYAIEFDEDDNLWCSSENGLFKIDSSGQLIARFSKNNGLQGNDFYFGSSYKDLNGHIYFGGPNGYNRFNPAEVEIDLTPPKILLTGIEFPGNSMPGNIPSELVDSLTLSHNDHFITFQYSVLDFVDPTKNQYRYKLENFDSEWIDNGPRNSSKYTALPPGDYIFRVQGANSAGIWNTDGLSLNLSVLPPPWKTWWAYSIYLVIILFLIWCLFRAVFSFAMQKESQRRNRALFEAEERAADDLQEQLELQDELIRSAHRHNRDILSQIQNFVDIPSADEAQANDKAGQRISALTFLEDCLFYHAGGPVADLHKYTELLVPHLLQHASIKPETVVTINEVTPGLVDADLALPLSVVIFEILDNCLKHAFDAESPANYIQIKLSSKPDEMSIRTIWTFIIRDSGKGIPSEKLALKDSEGGLYLVNSIIKKLNGEIATNNENGTRISIIIPHVEAA